MPRASCRPIPTVSGPALSFQVLHLTLDWSMMPSQSGKATTQSRRTKNSWRTDKDKPYVLIKEGPKTSSMLWFTQPFDHGRVRQQNIVIIGNPGPLVLHSYRGLYHLHSIMSQGRSGARSVWVFQTCSPDLSNLPQTSFTPDNSRSQNSGGPQSPVIPAAVSPRRYIRRVKTSRRSVLDGWVTYLSPPVRTRRPFSYPAVGLRGSVGCFPFDGSDLFKT
jgi:hypothetical protein